MPKAVIFVNPKRQFKVLVTQLNRLHKLDKNKYILKRNYCGCGYCGYIVDNDGLFNLTIQHTVYSKRATKRLEVIIKLKPTLAVSV